MKKIFCFLFYILLTTPLAAQTELETQLQKGIAAFEKGKHAQAERIFDKLLEQEPSYGEVYIWKAKCLQEFEDYAAAYQAFKTALDLDPKSSVYWLEMGKFKYELGIASIRKPTLCETCGKSFLPETGELPKASHYYESAVKDITQALALDSKNANAYFYNALLYKALGDDKKACQSLQQAQSLQDAEALKRGAEICPK